jgi:Leucine-rich repeat (LRR) protein
VRPAALPGQVERVWKLSVASRLACAALHARWNRNLTTLAGLGGLAALTSLDVSECRLRDLAELRGCTGLLDLNVAGNCISSLEGLPAQRLTRLDASRCGLSGLALLADCRGLEHLDVDENDVSSLQPLVGLTSLTGEARRVWWLAMGGLRCLTE